MDQASYEAELRARIDATFASYPARVPAGRSRYPWMTGFLGDPFAGIWFLAENPSLKGLDKADNEARRRWGTVSPEAQWQSPTLRRCLKSARFGPGQWERGPWHCYLTNVIKEPDYAEQWKERCDRLRVAELWSSVLSWELSNSQPRLIVLLGNRVNEYVTELRRRGCLPKLPRTLPIHHYGYIDNRPDKSRGLRPMHRRRLEEYCEHFERARQMLLAEST